MKTVLCRVFQFFFNIAALLLPWRKAVPVQGPGSIRKIPGLLRDLGVKKPLVVTDPGLVKAGIAGKITGLLEQEGIPFVLFSEVEMNPSVNTVNRIQKLYLDEGCGGFIAVGGGSAMDGAKAAAARVARPRTSVNRLGGLLRVLKKLPSLIAVPTTAGTGSETTVAALITDTETRHKYAIMDPCLIPPFAVLDPELTLGLPPALTATTGMDALTHAVEAYLCTTCTTKESRQFAQVAARLIFENLERAYKNGADIEARQAMLLASYKAGFAFTRSGVGNIHAIAHTLGGIYNTPHGLANAVILPRALLDYGKAAHKKLARLALAAGIGDAEKSAAENAGVFIKALYDMNERMGIPKGFDFIKDEDIPQMVAWADRESNPVYPVPVVFSRARFRSLIESLRLPAAGR
jgi:alcohol dehydrogenase class IV